MLTKAAEQDRLALMEYCLVEPNINLFILGDIEHFGFDSSFQEVWFQTQAGQISAVALRYHDSLIIYSRDGNVDHKELRAILDTRQIRVISGKQSVVDPFFATLGGKYSRREMVFCELHGFAGLAEDNGEVEVANAADAMEIAHVYDQISEFAGLYAADLNLRHQQIANRITSKEGVHMVIRRDGKIISHANSAGETSVSAMIGGILTLPEFRGKGLGSQVISAVCRDLARRGRSACLFYDSKQNGNIFTRLGFKATNNWIFLEKGTNE
jgi:predicted GNAT family acetyltransferase